MDEFVKKEIMEELCSVHSMNPKILDRITYLINGDFPKYIVCLKEEIKEAHEEKKKLQKRIQELESESLYNQITMRRIAGELNTQAKKLEVPRLK